MARDKTPGPGRSGAGAPPSDRIRPTYIEAEMRESYVNYAMSVIVGRALPDVRDGLKPVHRRILYAMRELGLDPGKPFKKSARIVGETLGKYHPHGDAAVYETMVRMVQPFSLRYPLVDGQGNFGSVDGDAPAAMRYTEARLAAVADTVLQDLDKETVDFTPNFDGSLTEPRVMPTVLPNLLVNGSSGIAVGMATNIPPHNLAEIVEAAVLLIENPAAEVADLLKCVKGPDFPTGGIIRGREGIRSAYTTGRGLLRVQAVAEIEEEKGRTAIIVTEIPYQVNKAVLIEEIAELIQSKRIDEVADLRDESDRDGMRIVVELRRGANAKIVLNQLYAHSQMTNTFGVIMLALVDGRPKLLTLKEALQLYIRHRSEVVRRRTTFELGRAEARAHIVEGLKKALLDLDRVIKIIRGADDVEAARRGLMTQLGLSELQAKAILEMQLQRLTKLERHKLEQEYAELIKRIEEYRSILASERKVLGIVRQEILSLKQRFGDERRTKIQARLEELEEEDLIAEEEVVIPITHSGYIKRLPVSAYRKQRRGGVGVTGFDVREEDFVQSLYIASTHDYILFLTSGGRLYWLRVHEIPEAGRQGKGKAIVNLLQLRQGEVVTSSVVVRDFERAGFLLLATKQGLVKKTALEAFSRPRAGGIQAIHLQSGDVLVGARLTDGKSDMILGTKLGQAIRFKETQVRPMGRAAAGVKGMTLEKGDEVIAMAVAEPKTTLLTVTAGGVGKRTAVEQYRVQSRGGKGIINMKLSQKGTAVIGFQVVRESDELMVMTHEGMVVRCPVKDIRMSGRSTQGVRVITPRKGDRATSMATVAAKDDVGPDNPEPA